MIILFLMWAYAQHFHCQVMPQSFVINGITISAASHPTQVLESQSMCPTEKKEGYNVICLYEALCRPVSEKESEDPPPEFEPGEAMIEYAKGRLHRSSLICLGKATIRDGNITDPHCEAPADCKKREILYNYMPEKMAPKDLFKMPDNTTQNVNVPNAAWETQ